MKKTIILIIAIILGLVCYQKFNEHKIIKSFNAETLYVFSQEGCGHCHNALSFINNKMRLSHPTLKVEVLDIKEDGNYGKLLTVAKAYDLDMNALGTPVLLFNEQTIIGWGAKSEEKLLKLLGKKS